MESGVAARTGVRAEERGNRMTQTLTIDGWHPVRLNTLLRLHWSIRNASLKLDANLLAVEAYKQGIVKAKGKRRVSLAIRHQRGVKAPDPDAFWKSTLDGLVKCRLLVDDSARWCELGPVSVVAAEGRGMTLVLEDM